MSRRRGQGGLGSGLTGVVRFIGVAGTAQVSTDISGKGTNYLVCAEVKNVVLPTKYYFGVSASTGGLAGMLPPLAVWRMRCTSRATNWRAVALHARVAR